MRLPRLEGGQEGSEQMKILNCVAEMPLASKQLRQLHELLRTLAEK